MQNSVRVGQREGKIRMRSLEYQATSSGELTTWTIEGFNKPHSSLSDSQKVLLLDGIKLPAFGFGFAFGFNVGGTC